MTLQSSMHTLSITTVATCVVGILGYVCLQLLMFMAYCRYCDLLFVLTASLGPLLQSKLGSLDLTFRPYHSFTQERQLSTTFKSKFILSHFYPTTEFQLLRVMISLCWMSFSPLLSLSSLQCYQHGGQL